MSDAFDIQITGPEGQEFDARVSQHLGELPTKALPVMWWWVAKYFGEVPMARQFDKEGGYLGAGWAQIDDRYRRYKASQFGPQADYIGRRSLSMREVFTNFHGEGGIFEVIDGGHGAEIGGEVFTDKGDEYAEYFNRARKLFGESIPTEAEHEMGKLAAMVYMLTMRMGSTATTAGMVRADGELTPKTWLDELPDASLDQYIDGLIGDLE